MYHFPLPDLFFWQMWYFLWKHKVLRQWVLREQCGSFLNSSTQTSSAELTVQAAFFSACFFCTLSTHAARFHFHLPYLFSRQMWHLLWKYISSGRQVRTRTKEMIGRKHDIRYSCFYPGDMRYFCFGVICLQRYPKE
ncbi:hypothetical protein DVH24_004211 [Malus domestica]|uniref:Uncharacterized protein n=1 Tax=Malus domestica TaxID=3750 RepID=A0A498K5N4_MALDO|nr:hypothetical protein DVH24_004211 [Malus domestica]